MSNLPYICPEHPEAQIRHEWNRTRTTIRLTGAVNEYDHGHQFFCNACGRELAAEAPAVRHALRAAQAQAEATGLREFATNLVASDHDAIRSNDKRQDPRRTRRHLGGGVMLRDPKDVANAIREDCCGPGFGDCLVRAIRADRAAVIAEAKLVVSECAYVGFPEMILRKVALAALDAILMEKE